MKPKIGRKVYCIYGTGILVDTVGFLGENSFIINSFGTETELDSLEWDYNMYNEKWFTSLSKAKKKLVENNKCDYNEKLKVVKMSDTWYTFEE